MDGGREVEGRNMVLDVRGERGRRAEGERWRATEYVRIVGE